MMNQLILSLTLVWALLSTAGALQCLTCTNLQCSTTQPVTCSSETMCYTASFQANLTGSTAQPIFMACAPSSVCPATGPQAFSVNIGFASAVASVKCCNTDNCNAETLQVPGSQTDNGKKCFSCDPITSLCTTQIQCRGAEDQCFQANVTTGIVTVPAFGCASTNLCTAATGLGSIPFFQSVGNITSGPSCCGTSLCNTGTTLSTTTTAANATTTSDASSIRLGVIYVLLGLLIFISILS